MFVNENIKIKGSASMSYGLDITFMRPSYHLYQTLHPIPPKIMITTIKGSKTHSI